MCIESLPDHLKSIEAWKGTDHDNWLFRWFIPLKLKYLCFDPRDTHKRHKWREWPITLFAIKSIGGVFRIETEVLDTVKYRDVSVESAYDENVIVNEHTLYAEVPTGNPGYTCFTQGYLSRIQYYTRWHIQFQWPFFVAFHFYFKAKDVPEYGKPRPETDGKLFYSYFGAHRDADKVYWIPSAYVGLNWK